MKSLKWSEVAPHPSSILVAGDVGTGKTALAGTYIQYAMKEKLRCFSVRRNFPNCKRVNESFTAPKNSVILVDDAHLTEIYAHTSGSKTKRIYDMMQRQKRHRKHSIVYTTQDTTGFGLRLIRLIDAICLFPPNMMSQEYERQEVKTLYTKALKDMKPWKLGKVWIQHQNRETHEVTEDVYTFMLPKFWTDEVSINEKPQKTQNLLTPVLDIIRGIGRAVS